MCPSFSLLTVLKKLNKKWEEPGIWRFANLAGIDQVNARVIGRDQKGLFSWEDYLQRFLTLLLPDITVHLRQTCI